jgi:hypothetical protein
MEEKRDAYRILVGKPEGKGPLETPRQSLMDNIKLEKGQYGLAQSDSGYELVEGSC